MGSIGASERRKDGPEKVCGRARYIDDYDLPGCLSGVTLRSTIACGTIQDIHFEADFPWGECVVAAAVDIPGKNSVLLIESDQPLLVHKQVMHPEEAILLVAHRDRETAYEALEHIHVDYREESPVLDMEESLQKGRILDELNIQKGDVEAGLAGAAIKVEGEYRLPPQEQAYIENNGVAAWFEEDGTLVVMGSLQCPYYVQKALMPIFGLGPGKVRVIQATTGGGFGGKEEYPSMIAGHAALLALKARRPVKIIYDRHEDMLATTKRHPAQIRHRTGVSETGELLAQDIDILMDGGAYATLSQVVLSRGILHATGPYECPNVRLRARVVATNSVPNGAFRGFGAPQVLFAAELHWERIAKATGIDSLSLRRQNLVVEGSVLATGQVLRESVGAREVLERSVERSGFLARKREYEFWNQRQEKPSWKGIGLALVLHGSGFTGSGEVHLASRASVTLTRDGVVRVDAASTELGQGTTSMFAQIVAESLDLPYEWIRVQTPDTSKVPDSGPTVASRTCMVVGALLQSACAQLRQAVISVVGAFPKTQEGLKRAAQELCNGEHEQEKSFTVQYEPPAGVHWDEDAYRGDAYAVYSYAAGVVELEVDKLTYEVKVNQVTTAQDVGKAINPLLVEGQIIGGTAQGLGYALLENAVLKDGRICNASLTDYIIPTFLDTPLIDVEIVEVAYAHGPRGAKGVGEMPMDLPAPAVAAAIHDATGLFIPELPILPETIARGLGEVGGRQGAER